MSYLITGGTLDDRQQKAMVMAKNQFHASTFDTIIIGIVGETSIGIGQIRDLSHQLSLKPYNSEAKVAIIHPGEMLTLEAQNALLKTLEEPNQSSILILTAPQADFLLPTIVSRCQIIKLQTKPEIQLDQKSLTTFYLLLTTLLQAGVGGRLKFASTFKNKEEIKEWLTKMFFALHEILLDKKQNDVSRHAEFIRRKASLISASDPTDKRILNQVQNDKKAQAQDNKLTRIQIVETIRSLEKTRNLIDQNINHKLALEIFLLDLPKI